MLTSSASRGWAFVKATWIVSAPSESYFAYGRSPGTLIRLLGVLHVSVPSACVANVGW